MKNLGAWIVLLVILALATLLRTTALDVDPPVDITGGPSPNEGLYALNARNRAVEGTGKLDDWNSAVLHPVGSAALTLVFEAAGVGLREARLLSVVFSLLALVLFFELLREASGLITALLGTLFLGTNTLFLVYSRTASPAPLGVVLMLLTILLWRFSVRRSWMAAPAGASLAFAAVIENGSHNMFFLLVAFIASLMVRMQAWKMPWTVPTRRRVRAFWAGALLTLATWGLVFVYPNRDEFVHMLNTPLSRLHWGNTAQNLFMAPFNFGRFLQWTPVLSLLSLFYILIFARTLMAPIARHRPMSETRAWFFAWIVAGPLFMALRSERPLNVLVMLVPPLCMAAAEALTLLLASREIRKPKLDILVVLGLLSLITWIGVQTGVHALVLLGYHWIPAAFYEHQFRYEFALVVLLATPITVLLGYLWLRWKKFTFEMSPHTVSLVFGLLLAGVLFTHLVGAGLVLRGNHLVSEAAATLRTVPGVTVLGGTWAPLLGLESGHRGLVIWETMNRGSDVLDRHGVSHLLLQQGSREALEVNPDLRLQVSARRREIPPVRTIHLGQVDLDLYDVTPGAAP